MKCDFLQSLNDLTTARRAVDVRRVQGSKDRTVHVFRMDSATNVFQNLLADYQDVVGHLGTSRLRRVDILAVHLEVFLFPIS